MLDMYYNSRLQKTQPQVLRLLFKITAAKTVSELAPGGGALWSFDTITQATLDAFQDLAAAEVPAANFDATAMGTDAFGGVVNMAGQAGKLLMMTSTLRSSTDLATTASKTAYGSAGLTASTLATECGLTTNGNIMFRAVHTGVDALTSGLIQIDLFWIPKPA